MNIAQIIRLALFNADAVNLDETTHRQITEPECVAWVNEGCTKLEKQLRNLDEDYLAISLQSNDTDYRFRREVFDVSLLLFTGGRSTANTYKRLPPDLVKIKRIRALGTEAVPVFEHMDASNPVFRNLLNTANAPDSVVYWDITGEGTLYVANPPLVSTGIELTYISRSVVMQLYTTGTITTTQDLTAVTGGSTAWDDNEVMYWGQNADLIYGTTTTETPTIIGTSTSNVHWVDPSRTYSPIAAITSNTALTILGAHLPAAYTSGNYMIASVPNLRPEDTWALVEWVTFRIAFKIGNFGKASAAKQSFGEYIGEMILDAQRRQIADFEFVDDYDAGDTF